MSESQQLPEHVEALLKVGFRGIDRSTFQRHYFNMTDEFREIFPKLYRLLSASEAYTVRRHSETIILISWMSNRNEPFGWECELPVRSVPTPEDEPNEFRVLENVFGRITGWLGVEIALPFGGGEYFYWSLPGLGSDTDTFLNCCRFHRCRVVPDTTFFVICGTEANGDCLVHDLKTSRVYIMSYGTGPIGDSDILVQLEETPTLYEVKGAPTFRDVVEYVAGKYLSLLEE